jgi:hypothetical protein
MAGAVGQGEDARLERLVLHRPELVEQRRNPDGRQQVGDDDERHQGHRGIQPPSPRALAQQQVRHPDDERSDEAGETDGDERVGGPLLQRLIRQAVGVLPDELLVIHARQVDNRSQEREENEVDGEHEEPLVAADPLRPIAHPGRETRRQDDHEQRQRPDLIEHPQPVAALVVLDGPLARRRHIDWHRFVDRRLDTRIGRLRRLRRRACDTHRDHREHEHEAGTGHDNSSDVRHVRRPGTGDLVRPH